ncbi:MAG: acetyl-CoA carboxylase, biotin carboxyl carrier protein [Elusimicrobia bacterium]|nr:acetyl-CoA carboxylase, biotin carboxyl carrier protein [Elusimicrobiota bacterium]
MTREGLEELEWAEGSVQMYLKRATKRSATAGPGTTGPSLPMEFEPPESSGTLRPLKSPLAGIFYRSSSPASPPYVQEGDTVSPGMTLCIVEAMKVMNEIKADQRYRVVKVLIENGKPVTAGQPLFLLQPL